MKRSHCPIVREEMGSLLAGSMIGFRDLELQLLKIRSSHFSSMLCVSMTLDLH